MGSARYISWQDGAHWLGFFEEYPDYMTQGESLEDLQDHLKDLYHDLTSGEIPGVRKAAELAV
jgi:hypothetical protein